MRKILRSIFFLFVAVLFWPVVGLAQGLTGWNWESVQHSKPDFVCAGIGVLDLGGAIDGPLYYFRNATRELISSCGGRCMSRAQEDLRVCKTLCPPPEWVKNDCNTKQRKFVWRKSPDISAKQAWASGRSNAGCDEIRRICKTQMTRDGGNWVLSNTFLHFDDEEERSWTRSHGASRIVLDRKGWTVETTRWKDPALKE